MFNAVRRHIDKLVFSLGLALVIFALGIAVGKFRLFPHDHIQAAINAAQDWRDNWRHHLGILPNWVQASNRPGGVSRYDPARAWPGHTFMNLFKDGAFRGVLVDMDGRVLHEWSLPLDEIWRRAGFARSPMPDLDASMHGVQMTPNGDLVIALAGAALVRLDACSRVVWALKLQAHHSVDVLPNGEIWVPVKSVHDRPNSAWPRLRPGPNGIFEDQLLTRVSPDGRILEQISLTDAIYASDWMGLLFAGRGSDYSMAEEDPYHLNDIEQLRPEMAAAFPEFAPGDILVNPRNLQSMLVLDGSTKRVKWSMTGPFFGQHDPDFTADGTILMFDNRLTGNEPQLGYSKVMEVAPTTHAVVWSYEGTKADPLYSRLGGRVQRLPNGNVLVGEPQGGRVFELARDPSGDSTVVWQYVNALSPGSVGMVLDMQRFPVVTEPWLGQACQ